MKKVILAAAMLPGLASAGPIDSVSTTLYGDTRTANPDGIELSVEGLQDGANEDIFNFTVDFTDAMSAIHPTAKLSEFYFNVDPNDASQWVVSNVTAGYNVLSPATVQGGGNNTGFLFELDQQPPNSTGVPLEFTLQYLGGEIMSENFTNALDWVSNDGDLDPGQMGAHVLSLTIDEVTCQALDCVSDSGFAVGDWEGTFGGTGGGGGGGNDIPEPGMLGLLSMGLAGLIYSRRKQRGMA